MAKLVRDRVPLLLGAAWRGHVADAAEFRVLLAAKLLEEAAELLAAATPAEVAGEAADVLEVVDALCCLAGVDQEQVAAARAQKLLCRGGFLGRQVWHGLAGEGADEGRVRGCEDPSARNP